MMRFVEPAGLFLAEERIRKEFNEEAHQELIGSILSKGLFHAPIVRLDEVNERLELVAGERRWRAIMEIFSRDAKTQIYYNGALCPPGMMPITHLHELPPDKILEVELEENVCRRDLTFLEQAQARKRLFDLRVKQAAARGENYSVKDLSEELQKNGVGKTSMGHIFRELQVARQLDKPGVKEAASLKEAEKAARRATESFILEALGDDLAQDAPPVHTFCEGDALEILSTLEPNQYDCVLTDPPYGIDIDDSGSMVTHDHHYSDSDEVLRRILDVVPYHLWRITRATAHVYWFCDLRWFAEISAALEDAGFVVCKYPIIWWKRGKAMAPDITRWPKREYECIIYAIKGDHAPLKVAGDVISTPYGSDLQQAEKPKELYVELLSRSVLAGQKVIDPFCGSGVIFTAAEQLGCSATGIEIHPGRADLAKMRAHGF